MHLIADGGSTKVEWLILENDHTPITRLTTAGLNPSVMSAAAVAANLTLAAEAISAALPQPPSFSTIEYYGAGCRGEASKSVAGAIGIIWPDASVTVGSDMLGACRAVCPGDNGHTAIVCILGTGANSALYHNGEIVRQVPPLGYILGDEGSGAWIGKRFVADLLKGFLPAYIVEDFYTEYPELTYDNIIRHVYRPSETHQPANSFLASFTPLVARYIDSEPRIQEIITEGFGAFINRNIRPYFADESIDSNTPIYFIGGVAHTFAKQLSETIGQAGLKLAGIRRSPLG